MGEIAQDMTEGRCCAVCGVYFTRAHGFPVLCAECWKEADTGERRGHQKASAPERG